MSFEIQMELVLEGGERERAGERLVSDVQT